MSKAFPKKFQILGKEHASASPQPAAEGSAGIYAFGPFRVDSGQRVLLCDGNPLALTPKAFDTLLVLVENHGRLVSKAQLLDAVWPDAFVEEKTLAQNILTVRKALGAEAESPGYIETVPKRGYRFRAEVSMVENEAAGVSLKTPPSIPSVLTEVPRELSRENFQNTPRRQRRWIVIGIGLAIAAGVALLFAVRYFRRTERLATHVFKQITVARLTHDGNITAVGLSPDGNWVAFAANRNGQQALSVQQVVTGIVREIVPPAEIEYRGVTLSRDGQWVYYVVAQPEKRTGSLYRVALLGGPTERLSSGSVDSRVDLSPDGKQLAFVRWTDAKTTALMVANVDGSGERQLSTRDHADGFSPFGPAWSPDGKVLVLATASFTGAQRFASLVEVKVADGIQHILPAGEWSWIGQLSWLPDGSGVVMTAWDHRSDVMSDQVWLLNYPGGEMRRITADINGYLGVAASADGKLIVATQTTPNVNFWAAKNGDSKQAIRITQGAGDMFSERLGMAAMPDGRIVYASWRSGNPDLWIMNADGTGQRQLTNAQGADLQPTVSPDGKQIAFITTRTGERQLYVVNVDDGHQMFVADADGERTPVFIANGSALIFVANAQGTPVLWRVRNGYGVPAQFTQFAALSPAVSPDEKSIACILPEPGTRGKLGLLASVDGHLVKQFDVAAPLSGGPIRWSPDGKALDYILTIDGVSNIWRQPIDGGSPKQLTDWKADRIFRFDWSRDGQLSCERGNYVDDVILIRDTAVQ